MTTVVVTVLSIIVDKVLGLVVGIVMIVARLDGTGTEIDDELTDCVTTGRIELEVNGGAGFDDERGFDDTKVAARLDCEADSEGG